MSDIYDDNELDNAFRSAFEGQRINPPPSVWEAVKTIALEKQLIHLQTTTLFLKGAIGVLTAMIGGMSYVVWQQSNTIENLPKTMTVIKTDTLYVKEQSSVTYHSPSPSNQTPSYHSESATLPQSIADATTSTIDVEKNQTNVERNKPTHIIDNDANVTNHTAALLLKEFEELKSQNKALKTAYKKISRQLVKTEQMIQESTDENELLSSNTTQAIDDNTITSVTDNRSWTKNKKPKTAIRQSAAISKQPSAVGSYSPTGSNYQPSTRTGGTNQPSSSNEQPIGSNEQSITDNSTINQPSAVRHYLAVTELQTLPLQTEWMYVSEAEVKRYRPKMVGVTPKPKLYRKPLDLSKLSVSAYYSPDRTRMIVQRNEPEAFEYANQKVVKGETIGLRLGFQLSSKWSIQVGLENSTVVSQETTKGQSLKGEPKQGDKDKDNKEYLYRTAIGTAKLPTKDWGLDPRREETIKIGQESTIEVKSWQIPVSMRYDFWQKTLKNNLEANLYAVGGGYLLIPHKQEITLKAYLPQGREIKTTFSATENIQKAWGLWAGAGAELGYQKHWNLFIEPTYSRDASSLVNNLPYKTFAKRWGGRFGINYKF
jgi:hypothetical protein